MGIFSGKFKQSIISKLYLDCLIAECQSVIDDVVTIQKYTKICKQNIDVFDLWSSFKEIKKNT